MLREYISQVVTREVEQIDAVTGDSYSHSWARLAGNLIPADATLRGLVDMNDSEAAFSLLVFHSFSFCVLYA